MTHHQEKLRDIVDSLFAQYDKDNNGALDKLEIRNLYNETLMQQGHNRKATDEEVNELLELADGNKDDTITKEELLKIFRKVSKK